MNVKMYFAYRRRLSVEGERIMLKLAERAEKEENVRVNEGLRRIQSRYGTQVGLSK
jgi:hypothetical protein